MVSIIIFDVVGDVDARTVYAQYNSIVELLEIGLSDDLICERTKEEFKCPR